MVGNVQSSSKGFSVTEWMPRVAVSFIIQYQLKNIPFGSIAQISAFWLGCAFYLMAATPPPSNAWIYKGLVSEGCLVVLHASYIAWKK